MTINEYKDRKDISISCLCDILSVSRASYYKWLRRTIPIKEQQDGELAALIIEYNETFEGILGYRRMTMYVNQLNQKKYSEKYVRRIMRIVKVKARIRRKKSNYIKSKPEQIGENVLHREFKATHLNQKWCTDVSEFKVPGQTRKLYLSAIIDLYDKSIVSYVFSNRNDNKLVFDTFELAIKNNPFAKPIFHSDRGFQYTSKIFKYKLDETGMIQSMSRVGRCIDNGPMEGFWGTLKSEAFYGIHFSNEIELRKKIEEYIFFYNNYRFQANLKGMTPNFIRYHSYCEYISF